MIKQSRRFAILIVLVITALIANLGLGAAESTTYGFRFPLEESWTVTQDFGVYNSNFGGYHLGEDVLTNSEVPVYAPANGIVKHNSSRTSYGYVVIIEHQLPNGNYVCSVLGHLRSEGIAEVDSEVTKGQIIGYLSSDPSENGGYDFTHLHFGIRKGSYNSNWVYWGYGASSEVNNWYDPSNFVNDNQGVSILDQSISPNVVSLGGETTFVFNINNPNTESIENIRLGAQIRTNDPQGEWIDDPANDLIITLLPGAHDYSRTFTVPQSAGPGFYDARWVILDGTTGDWIDSKTMTRIFEIETDTEPGRSDGPDNFGYTFKDSNVDGGPTYNWIEISDTGNQILLDSDDNVYNGVNIGFFFNYYGTDYSQLAIANNGLIFSTGTTWQYVNDPISQSPGVHGFIAPFWDDLVTWGEGKIYCQTLGTAPNRIFVVEWVDNQHYSSSDSGVTFEVILYEGSNNIKFQYKDVVFGNVYSPAEQVMPFDYGGSATVGIESPEGTDGLQYSFNEQVIRPEMAILFKFPQSAGTNLYLSKQAPGSKDHGSSMTYMLYYHNFGDTSAQNVVLEDELSGNIVFESASDDGIYDSSSRTVRWNIGSVAPGGHGYRILTVRIPQNIPAGTVIPNNAGISTSNLEVRYDDNQAYAQTRVTGSTLPPNVGVEPNNGGIGTPSVYWGTPITFSYHSCESATDVDIRIHIDDGGSDIIGNMAGGPPDWTYTTTFYPRHGHATVTYTVHGCETDTVSFDIYIDPAGYIYDIQTGERIAGASVWLQRPDGTGGWENVPTGESIPVAQPDINPQVTGEDGMYQWDVIEGSYRVHVEAPGYEPANSIVVSVPPPVFDLHVGLVYINAPPVANAGGPYEGTAGVALRLNGSESYDPDENRGDSIVSYEWDLDGDGLYDDATGEITEYVWNEEYSGNLGLRVTDSNGAVGIDRTTVNIEDVEVDVTLPTIRSITLYPANTTADSVINVTVDAIDNVDVIEVTAGNIQLIEVDGIWQGNITAPSLVGAYSLLITASDAAGNTAETTANYRVVAPTGSLGVGIGPKTTTASISGTTIDYTVNIKSIQNFDDRVSVSITMDGLPESYQISSEWFDWNNQTVNVPSNSTVSLPLKLTIPPGEATGRKAFKVKANSTLWITSAYDSGIITIS